jgi:ribonuclease-3
MNLSYTFKNPALLDKALTHPSSKKLKINDFERLEFLGDRILGHMVADLLYHTFPKEKEGDLAKRQAVLISREVCQDVARELDLAKSIKFVGTEFDGKSSVLSDAMEALIAAVYLDGGMEAVNQYILPYWKVRLTKSDAPPKDSKSLLQEWTQSRGMGIPQYELVGTSGPAHAPEFEMSLTINDITVSASGKSRKVAEQEVAKEMLIRLK